LRSASLSSPASQLATTGWRWYTPPAAVGVTVGLDVDVAVGTALGVVVDVTVGRVVAVAGMDVAVIGVAVGRVVGVAVSPLGALLGVGEAMPTAVGLAGVAVAKAVGAAIGVVAEPFVESPAPPPHAASAPVSARAQNFFIIHSPKMAATITATTLAEQVTSC